MKMKYMNRQRMIYADILKIVAIIAIIILHSSGPLLYKFNSIKLSWWWIGNIIDSATRWGVPIFIMVSGMLLLDPKKDESIREFLSKRFNRVLIPFIFWGVGYTILSYYKLIIEFQPLPILNIIEKLLTGQVFYHLWFIYMILGLYIVTPIIRIYVKNADLNNLRYFIIIWFITNGFFIFIQKISNFKLGIDLSFFVGFIGYYILGHYLHITNFNKKQINYIYFLSIGSFIATAIGTYILTLTDNGVFNEALYDYLSPNVILMSVGIFVFIKNYNWNGLIENRINVHRIIEFSSLIFGIYLVHALILVMLNHLPIKINAMFINPVIGIPFTSILTLLISFYIIKTLKRFSISRYIM